MQCPSCHSEVDDEAAVCPHCDAVVDPALFDVEPGPSSAPKAGRSGARRVLKKGVKKGKKKGPPKVERPLPDATSESEPSIGDWRSRVSKEDWEDGKAQSKPDDPGTSDAKVDPYLGLEVAKHRPNLDDEFMADAQSFMGGLSASDKVAFFGAAAMTVACFFPWRESIEDGEVLGLLSQAVLVFLLGAGIMTAIAVRTRHMVPRLNPLFVWVAQLGAASFSVLWVLVCIKLSWDSTLARATVGNEEVWVSKPGFGAFFGLFATLTATLGTALGLKDVALHKLRSSLATITAHLR